MKTHLRTRAFILCFLPFTILLTTSFWMIQRFVQATVREGLHTSLRDSQIAIANIHAKGDLRNSRFLRIAGENTALKAGMELARRNPKSSDARSTVEDQLRELGEHMGFDLMLVSSPDGNPLAGVARHGSQLVPLDLSNLDHNRSGFLLLAGRIFQVASVPVDVNSENMGSLTVGEFFNFSDLTTQVVLMRNGAVIDSNIPKVSTKDLQASLATCSTRAECDLHLNGTNWISLPMESYGSGYTLLSLDNVDEATRPIQAKLHTLFIELAFASVLVALLCSFGSSTSIVNPIKAVVLHLRNAVSTGMLGAIESQRSSIVEIQRNSRRFTTRRPSPCRQPANASHLPIFSSSVLSPTLLMLVISTPPDTAAVLVSFRARLQLHCNYPRPTSSAFASGRCFTTSEKSAFQTACFRNPDALPMKNSIR